MSAPFSEPIPRFLFANSGPFEQTQLVSVVNLGVFGRSRPNRVLSSELFFCCDALSPPILIRVDNLLVITTCSCTSFWNRAGGILYRPGGDRRHSARFHLPERNSPDPELLRRAHEVEAPAGRRGVRRRVPSRAGRLVHQLWRSERTSYCPGASRVLYDWSSFELQIRISAAARLCLMEFAWATWY